MFCHSCYTETCHEPEIRTVWTPEPFTGAITYSVMSDSFVNRHSFVLSNLRRFYVDVTDQFNGCTTYSEVVRLPYDCVDCDFQFIIDDQATKGPGQWNALRLYLLKNGTVIDSASTTNLFTGFDANNQVGSFVYNEVRGIVSYENDTLAITQ